MIYFATKAEADFFWSLNNGGMDLPSLVSNHLPDQSNYFVLRNNSRN
jgi:hypothetical protein